MFYKIHVLTHFNWNEVSFICFQFILYLLIKFIQLFIITVLEEIFITNEINLFYMVKLITL